MITMCEDYLEPQMAAAPNDTADLIIRCYRHIDQLHLPVQNSYSMATGFYVLPAYSCITLKPAVISDEPHPFIKSHETFSHLQFNGFDADEV